MARLRQWALFGVTIASTIWILPPASSQTVDPKLPLLPGEFLVNLQNGCAEILHGDEAETLRSVYAMREWTGGCRFGLAHGAGLVRDNKSQQKGVYYPMYFHYGHQLTGVFYATQKGKAARFHQRIFDGSPSMLSTFWTDPTTLEGASADGRNYLLAQQLENSETATHYVHLNKYLWVQKISCELKSNDGRIGFAVVSKQNIDNIKKGCSKNRLQHFFIGFSDVSEKYKSKFSGNYENGIDKVENINLCFKTDVLACSDLWAAMLRPYQDQAKTWVPQIAETRRAVIAELDARFAPLEAEAQRKIQRILAKGKAQ